MRTIYFLLKQINIFLWSDHRKNIFTHPITLLHDNHGHLLPFTFRARQFIPQTIIIYSHSALATYYKFDWDFTTKPESGGSCPNLKNFLGEASAALSQPPRAEHCRRCPSDAPDYYSQRQVDTQSLRGDNSSDGDGAPIYCPRAIRSSLQPTIT